MIRQTNTPTSSPRTTEARAASASATQELSARAYAGAVKTSSGATRTEEASPAIDSPTSRSVLAQDGTLASQGELATRILHDAKRSNLKPLGLGASAVEVDKSLAESDANGQGGQYAALAWALIRNADQAEYREHFDNLIAVNTTKRATLAELVRPPAIGPHCARGRATVVQSKLHPDEIAADTRGHEMYGDLQHYTKHGWPSRALVERSVFVKPVLTSFEEHRPEIAKAQAKDIAAGFTKIVGNLDQCVDFIAGVCDCPTPAYICEATGTVPKVDQDRGGEVVGVRVIHDAKIQNDATDSLPYCECDGPIVGINKGLAVRKRYIERGWRPEQVVLLAEKRDWQHAFKHNMVEPCSLFLMGVRLVLVMCLICGQRCTPFHDNECVCSEGSETELTDSFGVYLASSFGTRASAFNFGLLGNGFKWVMHNVLGAPLMSLYVDDTFSVGVAIRYDDGTVSEREVDREDRLSWASFAWTHLSARWGIGESTDKRIVGSAILNLGVVIDFCVMEVRLAPRRLRAVRALLSRWLTRSSSSRKDLQSLRGVVGWASLVVHGGTVALKLLDAALRGFNMRPAFRKRVAPGVKRAAIWLLEVFRRHSGSKLILTSDWIRDPNTVLDLATDASGGSGGGFGGYFGLAYFAGIFPQGMTLLRTIAELELATVVVALLAFGHKLRGQRIVMSCDNANANSAVQKGSATSSMLQYLSMALHKIADRFGIDMRITWVSSKGNKLADLASRNRAAFLARVRANGIGKAREVPVDPELFATIFAGFLGPSWNWEWTTTVIAGAAEI